MSQKIAFKIIVVLYPIVFLCLEFCSFPLSKNNNKKKQMVEIMKGSISSLHYSLDG